MATTAGLKDAETNIAANNKETPSFHMFENKTQHFYGRDDTIQALSEAIEERKDEADSFSRTIILTGFDGMGKSETVKAFVEKFQDSFDCIVWINAQTQQIFEASFRTLATKLNKCYNSFDGMRKIQKKLSKSYKKGLFILENAERLDTVDDQFGIEDFLYMDFLQNKSIFLATSRNGKDNWAGGQSKLKFITIDSLPKQDAIKMLKNYLLFPKNVKLPVSLENAISSLVDTLGGYPLGLSFIGSAVAGKTGSNSIAVTESKLKAYNLLLP